MPSQIKHDVMYHHHTMSGPPQRPLQVSANLLIDHILHQKKGICDNNVQLEVMIKTFIDGTYAND